MWPSSLQDRCVRSYTYRGCVYIVAVVATIFERYHSVFLLLFAFPFILLARADEGRQRHLQFCFSILLQLADATKLLTPPRVSVLRQMRNQGPVNIHGIMDQ